MAASQSNGSAGTNEPKPAVKSTPKDALVISVILKEMGISDYEPRIVNQMLEFTYRYITTVLDDAKAYSSHAGKKDIDADDVQLAIRSSLDHSYTSPPPRDFLIEIARQKNRTPLPQIQPKSGLRLPPDRYCLTGKNYKVKPQKKPLVRPSPVVSRSSSVSSSVGTIMKPAPAMQVVRPPMSTVTLATTPRLIMTAPKVLVASNTSSTNIGAKVKQVKTEISMASSKTITVLSPVPVQIMKSEAVVTGSTTKSSSLPSSTVTASKVKQTGRVGTPASMVTVSALPSMDETVASAQQPLITPQKRKHDDNDDYDV